MFAYDAVYCDSKDLAKRTISDKILKNRAYKTPINPINPKYDGYQRLLLSMGSKFFDKKTGSRAGVSVNEQQI